MLEGLDPVVVGAVLAALGYVGKLLLEWFGDVRSRQRLRRSHLVELFSLLRAGRVAFEVQLENRERLKALIEIRDPKLANPDVGFERLFTAAFPDMTEEEKELHTILRSITIHTVKPINDSLVRWLKKDQYFKARTWGHGLRVQLADKLGELEAHLLLWQAKYEVWIPDEPSHVFVYLADEEKHGVGFPSNIQSTVKKLLAQGGGLAGNKAINPTQPSGAVNVSLFVYNQATAQQLLRRSLGRVVFGRTGVNVR